MDSFDIALRLATAIAIGFLIGLERGWREREEKEGSRTAGIRTFTLIGLFGGIVGALSQTGDRLLLAASLVTLGAVLGAFMWREGEREQDFSATGLIAALITFMLGALAVLGDINIAAAAGVATVILLAVKEALHGWLRKVQWSELRSGLQLAAMTFIALPLLPRTPIDPWNAINPWQLWLMTVVIAAFSFAGYAAARIAGPRRGLIITALLGGVFASTAVTLTLARLARRSPGHERFLAGGILAAGAVMMVRVVLISGLINLPLARQLLFTLGPAALALALASLVFVRGSEERLPAGSHELAFQNPFDLPEVLRFGLLLAVVSVAVVLARQYYGEAGLFTLAAISGLAEVDAMTLSAARLPDPAPLLGSVVLLTVVANQLAKALYAGLAGGRRIGLLSLAGTLPALAIAALIQFVHFG